MNETIKSLAIQSGAVESHVDWENSGGNLLEKFAQLIVEETIHAIIKGGRGHLNPTLISKSAKEHFGL